MQLITLLGSMYFIVTWNLMIWLKFFPYNLQNELECVYYLRTGQCKFGSTCKFHHPQPSNMMVSYRGSPIYPIGAATSPSQQSYPGGITSWPLSRASFIPSPRWQGPSNYAPLILPQGVLSVQGWNSYNVRFHIIIISSNTKIVYTRKWNCSLL